MPLPRFIVLQSIGNKKYLGYVPPEQFKGIKQGGVARSRNSFLRFDRDKVSTTDTKFEVKPAKIGGGLVHLKSCYNNKYWVRYSPRHSWIVAAADQPEEDQTKWSCTLFKPVYIDQNHTTVRFIHLQLGHHVCWLDTDPPFGDCLYAGLNYTSEDSCDIVTVIDWESLSTSTSRPGGSGAAVTEDNNYIFGSKYPDRDSCDVVKVIDRESLSTSTSRPGGSGAAVAEDNNYIFGSAVDPDDDNSTSLPRSIWNGIAFLKGDQFMVKGTIAFIQEDTKYVTVKIKIKGIPYEIHALHIKTYGDISRGIALSEPTFLDLGNFESDRTGKLEVLKRTKKISLRDENSILGRTIVLYSKSNPDPGVPLAWGVIGVGP